jgi:hypothetical protein
MNAGLSVALVIGLFCLIVSLAARLGYLKFFFVIKGVPGIYPKSLIYALIPLGLLFLFALIFSELEKVLANVVLFILMIVVVITLMWQPGWLKPAWLRWLEDNYGHVLEEMFEEARQMGVHNWEAQVKTQADLERWADSVAEKHGWQRLGER